MESEELNQAALAWATYNIIGIIALVGVMIGFALSWALGGGQQAIPLFAVAALGVYQAVRVWRRRREFSQMMAERGA